MRMNQINSNGFRPRGPRRGGQPSVIVALALLGALAYFHYGKEGMFNNVSNLFKVEQTKEITPVVVKTEPNYVTTIAKIYAYRSKEGLSKVAVIPSSTNLRVMETDMDKTGQIRWLKVNANGLSVWVRNQELTFN